LSETAGIGLQNGLLDVLLLAAGDLTGY